jgi:NADPH:quinone reductase-like Zn-dependent oxidoreductase
MKASYITAYGGKEVVACGDVPDPVITDTGVIVKVKYASINPVDYKIKSGAIKLISPSTFPRILGTDFSGIVEKTGALVTGIKPGDRVYGAAPIFFGKPGTLAELLLVESKNARLMPDWLSFEDAASLPVGALTALNGLRKGNTRTGKKVLVNGATGGVGHFGLQIAKAKGAHVTATCSKNNFDFARSLGADVVTGYSNEELSALDGGYDVILDAYGKMDHALICRLLKRGGIYASTLFMPYSVFSAFLIRFVYNKKLTSSNLRSLPEDFDDLEKLLHEKNVKPYIDKTFTLQDAAEAFEYAEKGRPKGKVMVSVSQ